MVDWLELDIILDTIGNSTKQIPSMNSILEENFFMIFPQSY